MSCTVRNLQESYAGWEWGFAYLAGWSFEKYRLSGICRLDLKIEY